MNRLRRAGWLFIWLLCARPLLANPYLAKPGEPQTPIRVAACAISGGFIHLYTALDHHLFDKYGLRVEFLLVRGAGLSLAALTANEVQFVHCTTDAMIPSLAAGAEAKIIAAPLLGLPWVMVARKDIKRVEDLKGKSLLVMRPGGMQDRVVSAFIQKLGFAAEEIKVRHTGSSDQMDVYASLQNDLGQAALVMPPLDARAKHDGFNVIYHLDDLDLPAVYSSVFTNERIMKERPATAQRFTAAIAETIHFAEKNGDQARASVSKFLGLKDPESAQSAYDAYARRLVNRRLWIPAGRVAKSLEMARQSGAHVRRKPSEIYDNSFTENLERSGFLKELWGNEIPAKKW
jgi:NitT/TauT family transport system substrate-binding protein